MASGGSTARVLGAAWLAGAGGMGLQAAWLAHAGLLAGQSVAAAYGPGAYVAGWALGAQLGGRAQVARARGRAAAWALLGNLAALALLAGDLPGATARTLAALALCAIGSGFFLTQAARTRGALAPQAGLGSLLASSLLGSMCGAVGLGLVATGEWGRDCALLLSLATLLLGILALPRSSSDEAAATAAPTSADPWALAIVAGTTLWGLGLEWICARVAVMWIGSETAQLTLVVDVALLALALGASLSSWIGSGRRAIVACLVFCALGTIWPLHAAGALTAVRGRGDVALALALVVPTVMPLGAVLPVLHARARGESGRRLGDLLQAEILGALIAGPLLHGFCVAHLGISGTLALLCLVGGALAAAWAARERDWLAALGAGVACAALAWSAAESTAPALTSPKLVDPALTLRSFREDEHYSVAVVDDGVLGERTLLTDQFRAAGNGPDYRYMRALGHLPVLLHPRPRHVAVLALGTGTTLGAVFLHAEVERIDVLEISRAVVEAAPLFRDLNRGALEDTSGRVEVLVDDGRRTLARHPGRYDVITMEPLLPDSPFGVYLYTPEFYAVARAALAPGGSLCQWIPPHALEPDSYRALLRAFAASFPDARAWLFGTQLLLIGSERAPELAAGRLLGWTPELRAALEALGLDTAGGIAARHVAALDRWPAVERELSDWDPWIAWRSKPQGLAVLGWLALNLEQLEAHASSLSWGEAGHNHALVSLREARRAQAWGELELRRGELDAALARERALAPLKLVDRRWRGDPELLSFRDEVAFLHGLRSGVSALSRGDARAALASLLSAAEARPLRADAHAYVAAALYRDGNEAAANAAAQRARELCPRIARTPQGERAVALGLPLELLASP